MAAIVGIFASSIAVYHIYMLATSAVQLVVTVIAGAHVLQFFVQSAIGTEGLTNERYLSRVRGRTSHQDSSEFRVIVKITAVPFCH